MNTRFKRIENFSLRVQNAFIFLQNTYKDIDPNWFKDINLSEVNTIEDVYVITLCKVVNTISKRGLYKEYIKIEDAELISPKGRIDVSKSVTRQTRLRGKLICSYDELSDNVLHNKIIKTVLLHMIYNKSVSKPFIYKLQKALNDFNGVDTLDIKSIDWKRIRYNNSNIRYKTALDLCKSLIDIENISKITSYSFEDKLHIMFTKQLYNYYNKEFGSMLSVSKTTSTKWTSRYKYEKLVSGSRTYTVIRKEKEALIIGFERYNSWASAADEDRQLKHMKQVCEEYEEAIGNIKAKIGLIYINPTDGYTDKEIQIVNVDGKLAGYTVVDCNIGFTYIKYKLNQLINIMLKTK